MTKTKLMNLKIRIFMRLYLDHNYITDIITAHDQPRRKQSKIGLEFV